MIRPNQTARGMMRRIDILVTSSGALSWLNFPINSETGAFGQRLAMNAAILPDSLARSCA